MTLKLKITNSEAEGGKTAVVKAYDLTDANQNGRTEKKLVGENTLKPGEEVEVLVTEDRLLIVEEQGTKAKPSRADAPTATETPVDTDSVTEKPAPAARGSRNIKDSVK